MEWQPYRWPVWRKIAFRFFFIYLGLTMAPWGWWEQVPFLEKIPRLPDRLVDWMVDAGNRYLFHVRDVLVPENGSGDTSYAWAQLDLYICLSLAGCLIWTALDRHRRHYLRLNYWLCLFIRYYIALIAFLYGIMKVFALQMPFPNYSLMATPIGDLAPMRLSWVFIGYSTPYQVFSGAMEVLVGALLLYRRTATFGVMMGLTVFSNVLLLNLSYDIVVKLFSMHLVLMCLFLLANEYKRIASFLFWNRPAPQGTVYEFRFSTKRMRTGRLVLKIIFILVAVVSVLYRTVAVDLKSYNTYFGKSEPKPLKTGVYEVTVFAVNRDTLPLSSQDPARWGDVILDNAVRGSIRTSDTSFRQYYGRGYFLISTDSLKHTISFNVRSKPVVQFRYELEEGNRIKLWGKKKNDSLYVVLRRTDRHFQLAEKPFSWLNEAPL